MLTHHSNSFLMRSMGPISDLLYFRNHLCASLFNIPKKQITPLSSKLVYVYPVSLAFAMSFGDNNKKSYWNCFTGSCLFVWQTRFLLLGHENWLLFTIRCGLFERASKVLMKTYFVRLDALLLMWNSSKFESILRKIIENECTHSAR